jgi:hypothetical protein
LVNILSTINTFPHPKVSGFIINLFVNHHTTTAVAFGKSFPHPPPPLERESLIRTFQLKIPKATILSIKKEGCEKYLFENYYLKSGMNW